MDQLRWGFRMESLEFRLSEMMEMIEDRDVLTANLELLPP